MAAVWRRKSKPAYNWLCQEVRLDSLTIDNKENKVMAVTRGEDGLVRLPKSPTLSRPASMKIDDNFVFISRLTCWLQV